MAIDASVPRSRRALLVGGLGGLAALVASALGRPSPVDAGSDGDVVLGATNAASTTTTIEDTTTIAVAFKGRSTYDHGVVGESAASLKAGVYGLSTSLASAYGVAGRSTATGATGYLGGNSVGIGVGAQGECASGIGVLGKSTSGHGVSGKSTSGIAVGGNGGDGIGVLGSNTSSSEAAIVGHSIGDRTGILGFSGSGNPPAAPPKTGVYGYATQDGSSRGVAGQALGGRGVSGHATTGTGTYGYATTGTGVIGTSTSGEGIRGISYTTTGVRGVSNGGSGIVGESGSSGQPAALGHSRRDGTGVLGYSGGTASTVPAAAAKTGVYGYASQDAGARGVHGRSTSGRGIFGQATSGTGVYATATTGYALRAVGRVKLDKCAGVATITSGTDHVTVAPGIAIGATSAVVSTLQGNAGGSTTVKRVGVDPSNDRFTIYLTASAAQDVKVAWHVLG